MTETITRPTAAALASAFVRGLHKQMTVAQWNEMLLKNASGRYNLACASHDYVDANVIMAEAFEATYGRELLWGDDTDDTEAWNAAWDVARLTMLTAMPRMTARMKRMARNALGLPGLKRQTYRNHFCTGEGGPDHDDWMLMVHLGWARQYPPSMATGGLDLFRLTRIGAELALEGEESLCPEDFPIRA